MHENTPVTSVFEPKSHQGLDLTFFHSVGQMAKDYKTACSE